MVKFLKPYTGYYQKGKRKKILINYYDEREWRYIPKGIKYKAFPFKDINSKEIIKYNSELRSKTLTFKPTDIKYIIIAKENEKPKLAKLINKMTTLTNADRLSLISKIVSLKEIREDF